MSRWGYGCCSKILGSQIHSTKWVVYNLFPAGFSVHEPRVKMRTNMPFFLIGCRRKVNTSKKYDIASWLLLLLCVVFPGSGWIFQNHYAEIMVHRPPQCHKIAALPFPTHCWGYKGKTMKLDYFPWQPMHSSTERVQGCKVWFKFDQERRSRRSPVHLS